MKKYRLDCAYIVSEFRNHKLVKKELLSLIDHAEFESITDNGSETNITKADWHKAQDFGRDWVKLFADNFAEDILNVYQDLGYDGFTLHELWFQQYIQNSGHGWHTHSSNFTNVYYLELPKNSPKTQIVNPYNQTEVIEIDVKEGDLLTFPSFVIHRAPENTSPNRKTIISYNINATYSNEIYGKGIIT